MRLQILFLGVLVLASGAAAQAPTATDLHLRGDRFRPLTASELTSDQKTLVDHLLTGALLFMFAYGAGPLSLDALLSRAKPARERMEAESPRA